MVSLALVAAAWGAAAGARPADAALGGPVDLMLGPGAWWAEGSELTDGLCAARFREGMFIPVVARGAPDRRLGLAFVGVGDLRLELPARADAWAFANLAVLRGGADRAAMAPIAHQERPFTDTFSRALLLSADPALSVVTAGLDPVGGGVVGGQPGSDVDAELVVTSDRGEGTRRLLAEALLTERTRRLQQVGLDPRELLRLDRVLADGLGAPGASLRLLADYRTETRFPTGRGEAGPDPGDPWLTCLRDGTDHGDTGLRAVALAAGTDGERVPHYRTLAGLPFPEVGGEPGPSPSFVDPRVELEVEVKPTRSRLELEVHSRARVTLTAAEPGVARLLLRLPREEAVAGSWALERAALDGGAGLSWAEAPILEPLPLEAGSRVAQGLPPVRSEAGGTLGLAYEGKGSDSPMKGPTSTASAAPTPGVQGGAGWFVRPQIPRTFGERVATPHDAPLAVLLALPRPLDRGETLTLRLAWRARWTYAAWGSIRSPEDGDRPISLGASTGARSLLPELVPARGGTPWTGTVTVGLPPRELDLAVSGTTAAERVDEGGWRWTTSTLDHARRPALAVGRWVDRAEAALPDAGLPAVRAHTFSGGPATLSELGPEVRRVLVFLGRFLPTAGLGEFDVFEDPQTFTTDVDRGADARASGLGAISRTAVVDTVDADRAARQDRAAPQTALARQVAASVWGQRVGPANRREAWLTRGLADLYGALYLRAAQGEAGFLAFEARLDRARAAIERPPDGNRLDGRPAVPRLSLTDPGSLRVEDPGLLDQAAFFFLGRVLREHVGDDAYFAGLDRLARDTAGGRVTTDQLRVALEASSGLPLADLFDTWVYGGLVPGLRLDYAQAPDGGLEGCLESDVPFGVLEVPVVVRRASGERVAAARVRVVDGQGAFTVPADPRWAAERLEVALDPLSQLPARARDVQRQERVACGASTAP